MRDIADIALNSEWPEFDWIEVQADSESSLPRTCEQFRSRGTRHIERLLLFILFKFTSGYFLRLDRYGP